MKNFDIARRADGLYMKLREVGRKISKANAEKLRKAMQEMSDLLSQVVGDEVSEAERSYNDRQNLLRKALKSRLESAAAEGEYVYGYIADVFDTDFVYEHRGTFWRASYTIGEDGDVSIGTPVEVIPHMTYDPAPGAPVMATEAAIEGECMPLVEQNLQEAATAYIKLIAPGWGSSGYYPTSTLKAAAPVFSKGVKMFWNHQTAAEEAARPEGDLSNLAGELIEDSRWEDQGTAGPGLYARTKVFDAYKDSVKDLQQHIGVSIRASGLSKPGEAEGRKGPIIEKIAAARSVDFVTVPGAGGQVLQLFEAAGRRSAPDRTTREEKNDMDKAEIMALIAESQKPLMDKVTATETALADSKTENARLRETIALRDARDFTARKLATITMPDATRARLTETLTSRAIITDGRLDEAAFGSLIEAEAKKELEYLQGVTGGVIRGMGSVPVQETKVTTADLEASFRELGLSEAAAKYAAAGREAA